MAESQSLLGPMHYSISIPLYGNSTVVDQPCHVGIAVHSTTQHPSECHLHHIRCPSEVRYIYDPRPKQPFTGDSFACGRCVLQSNLSVEEADRANRILAAFGADESALPFWGQGNCQDWMAHGVRVLEAEGLVCEGDGAWWTAMIGRTRLEMERAWKEQGRTWVDAEASSIKEIDAKWSEKDAVPVGRLSENHAFAAGIGLLGKSLSARHSTTASKERCVNRLTYTSDASD